MAIVCYAIKYLDGTNEIVTTWDECRTKVIGIKGVTYKKFSNMELAQVWLDNQVILDVSYSTEQCIKVYVDGGYNTSSKYAKWAWVAVKDDTIIAQDKGVTPAPALSRNIDGELYACISAARYAFAQNLDIVIVHDYAGIGNFAVGNWVPKSKICIWYTNEIKKYLNYIKFEKVKGHTNNKWNEYVDSLVSGE